MNGCKSPRSPHVSIGVLCQNNEDSLAIALKSLFQQSIFSELRARNLTCEIICVASSCTDNTPLIAKWFCDEQSATHACKDVFKCRTVEIPEPEKVQAWNVFIHGLSTKTAQFCFLMDGNIQIDQPTTLWNMYSALSTHSEAVVAVDQPRRRAASGWFHFRHRTCAPDHSRFEGTEARFTGQLYCIRSEVARNLYLPTALPSWENAFIETIVCTDFLTHDASSGSILLAKNASHVSEPRDSIWERLRNQQQRMIGQVIVHILVDDHLRKLPFVERVRLAETLQQEEQEDPSWLRKLVTRHIQGITHFWQLVPGLFAGQFRPPARLKGSGKLLRLPVALAGVVMNLVSCWVAYHSLKHGYASPVPEPQGSAVGELPSGQAVVCEPRPHSWIGWRHQPASVGQAKMNRN